MNEHLQEYSANTFTALVRDALSEIPDNQKIANQYLDINIRLKRYVTPRHGPAARRHRRPDRARRGARAPPAPRRAKGGPSFRPHDPRPGGERRARARGRG